jgi:hypothetical protein
MTYLKSISDTISTWPTWKKVTFGFFVFASIGAVVNPQPQATPEQKAARSAQDAAEAKEGAQKDLETRAVVYGHSWLKESLNDPDSVEWLGTRVYRNLDICIEFSAKNQMGGRVKGFAAIVGGNLTINNVKAWDKRCGDSGSVRYY